jgi:signal transduction histidine kinase
VTRLTSSIRGQLILGVVVSLLVLAATLEGVRLYQQRSALINSERRVGLTLIRSVNNTINSVRTFISTLSDIAELDTRLAELVQLNDNIDFIAVTDAAGQVIFHSSDEYRGTTIPALSLLPPEETVSREVPGFGEAFLTALPFDSDGLTESDQYWIVVASASEPILNLLIGEAVSSGVVAALFTVLAGAALVIFSQYYFVRPVEQLTSAANAIEGGDLTVQITTNRNNEIGQLARSFNRMTQQVATLINTLEERVKERTRELESARDQAEHASRAKSDFLSNMSHELRTPLNMVIGYTSSMLNMPQMYNFVPLPDVYREDIQLIRESGRHLLTLINDILDLSKVEAGKLVLNFAAVDLNLTLNGVVAAALGLIGDKPVQLRQDYPEHLPKVWADGVRVRQILLNLLSNGIKYTETGSVTLFAEVRGESIYIAVTDTGPGIPETALSTIFDRFEQLQSDAEIQGTGLGLDISQRLAQLHGTEITIKTELGKGSTFAFTLPVATEEQLAQQENAATSYMENAQIFVGDETLQLTAEIVASETSVRQPLRRILEARHIVVVEAKDYAHAFDLASGLLPNFILLDTSHSPADGQRLLDQLQEDVDTRDIPVILIEPAEPKTTPQSPQIRATVQVPIVEEQLLPAIEAAVREIAEE